MFCLVASKTWSGFGVGIVVVFVHKVMACLKRKKHVVDIALVAIFKLKRDQAKTHGFVTRKNGKP